MRTIEINGIKFKFGRHGRGVITEVFKEDCYNIHSIPKESIVLDIGAHIGTFALRCAKERDCHVYAYEPSPSNFRFLFENVKLNNLEDKVKIFQKAIGERCETREFHTNPEHPAGSSLYLKSHPSFKDKPLMTSNVEVITLKQIFEDNDLTWCDVMKIDCEEAEREVFTDQSIPYFSLVGYLILEWHNYDGHVYSDYLGSLGFDVLLTGTGLPQPPYDPTFARGMLYAKNMIKGG